MQNHQEPLETIRICLMVSLTFFSNKMQERMYACVPMWMQCIFLHAYMQHPALIITPKYTLTDLHSQYPLQVKDIYDSQHKWKHNDERMHTDWIYQFNKIYSGLPLSLSLSNTHKCTHTSAPSHKDSFKRVEIKSETQSAPIILHPLAEIVEDIMSFRLKRPFNHIQAHKQTLRHA